MTKFYEKLNALCKEILSKSPPPRGQNQNCDLWGLWQWQKHTRW